MADERSKPTETQDRSPDALMTAFSRSPIALSLIVAVGVHVAVIAGTSLRYIRDTWLDPEGAELRRIEQDRQEQDARAERARQSRESSKAAASQPEARRPDAARIGRDAPDAVGDRARDSAIYRSTTQAADPAEIPREPGDLTLPLP